MQTSLGDIKIELYQKKAPVTVENFLQYVDSMKFEGFAAFGKVYEGLDVVRKIHQQKDSSQYLEVRIKILQIRRIEN
jgi:cyclophilin family peptidyl-prolyl cis-trans isomerase